MLFTMEGKKIKKVPYLNDFKRWRKNISDSDYNAVVDALNTHIDGDRIHTSSFIPGHNWAGTVYESIWRACNQNDKQAALFYGLILFQVMIDHDDQWIFGKFEKDGKSLRGTTYFKPERPFVV